MTIDVVDRASTTTDSMTTERQGHGTEKAGQRRPTAAQVMSRNPRTIDAQASLFSAWGQLHGEHNQHLVVIDECVRPIGVLDERDIALEWPSGPLGAHHLQVHTLLRCRARPRVRAADDVARVAAIMLGAREDALPVVDEAGRLLGLVTVWHCLEFLAAARSGDGRENQTAEAAPLGGLDPD
jgi:CBS-domain-containing membrane protein